MIAALGRAPYHPLERNTRFHHTAVNAPPIKGGVAREDFLGMLSGDLLPVDIVKSRASQPKRGFGKAVPKVKQTDMWKQARDLERIEIRSGGHAPSIRRPEPVVEQFALSLHHELGSKGAS